MSVVLGVVAQAELVVVVLVVVVVVAAAAIAVVYVATVFEGKELAPFVVD